MAEPRSCVLVVDDDPRNRELLRARLAGHYDVLEAESGAAALAALAQAPVDLVLLDVMMPEMNGFDTCRAIKARQRDRFLPVVLLTALSGQEDRNQGLAAGADEFLTKPVDPRELSLRLRSLLTLRAQEEQIHRHLQALERLQALKDDLFSLIMHDLRNPLTGVMGFLELLQHKLEGPLPDVEAARRHAGRAAEGARKLHELLEQALEVRRLEEAAVPLRPEAVPLAELAQEAVRTLEGAARARTVDLAVEVEAVPDLTLDRALARRALENLISNAIKVSPPAAVVTVRVRRADGRVALEVEDLGAGVADAAKPRLFGKFAVFDAPPGEGRPRGFGLGLHLVKLVADAHGGVVSVRDRPGGGSVFGLSFPEPRA